MRQIDTIPRLRCWFYNIPKEWVISIFNLAEEQNPTYGEQHHTYCVISPGSLPSYTQFESPLQDRCAGIINKKDPLYETAKMDCKTDCHKRQCNGEGTSPT